MKNLILIATVLSTSSFATSFEQAMQRVQSGKAAVDGTENLKAIIEASNASDFSCEQLKETAWKVRLARFRLNQHDNRKENTFGFNTSEEATDHGRVLEVFYKDKNCRNTFLREELTCSNAYSFLDELAKNYGNTLNSVYMDYQDSVNELDAERRDLFKFIEKNCK